MTTQSINMRECFGDRFKIGYDPAYYVERPEFRAEEDLWLQLILCQHGEIGPWGSDFLLACTRNRGTVATRLAALDCVDVIQDADDGLSLKFHIRDFEAIAEIMRPRRRHRGRRLNSEEKAKLVEAGRKYRFHTGRHGPHSTRQSVAEVQ